MGDHSRDLEALARQEATTHEPPPRPGRGDLWHDVIRDMEARREAGIERYGTPLQARNGRDALVDAYQEALDLVVYLRQVIVERAEESRLRAGVEGVVRTYLLPQAASAQYIQADAPAPTDGALVRVLELMCRDAVRYGEMRERAERAEAQLAATALRSGRAMMEKD